MGEGKLTLTALSYRLIVAAALAATTYACTKADALVINLSKRVKTRWR
jgi:hypothetical protein